MKVYIFLCVLAGLQDCCLGNGPSDIQLKQFSNALYEADVNNVGYQLKPKKDHGVNLQGLLQCNENASVDRAEDGLFERVQPANIFSNGTLEALYRLLNRMRDGPQNQISEEISRFLNAIMATNVMRLTEFFLRSHGLIENYQTLRELIDRIWFTPYRRGRSWSSGFKHVFNGEITGRQNCQRVGGLHNWVSLFQKEQNQNGINYKGFKKYLNLGAKGAIMKLNFGWQGIHKADATIFIGTTPELEMALITACFYARGATCTFQIQRATFRIRIRAETIWHNGNNHYVIGTAYPQLVDGRTEPGAGRNNDRNGIRNILLTVANAFGIDPVVCQNRNNSRNICP